MMREGKLKEVCNNTEATEQPMEEVFRIKGKLRAQVNSRYDEDLIIDLPEEDEIEQEKEKSSEMDITLIEFSIINSFLYSTRKEKSHGFKVRSYGESNISTGRITFGGSFNDTNPWWFNVEYDKIDDEMYIQTRMFIDVNGRLATRLSLSTQKGLTYTEHKSFFKEFINITYNNSQYRGKCLKIKLYDGRFEGIEILDISNFNTKIELSDTQDRFIKHFISRVGRGSSCRYLLNGQPGSGKTESIRNIIKALTPYATFIIPEFYNANDLIQILESCNIFEPGIIVIDDIDLYLGSRDHGSYTNILGQFLSFFDGVKKNKISILASTNDKGLVDKASERPGRMNLILDFGYLTDEQIDRVCNIHLPEKWRVKEIYNTLKGNDDNGKKINVTGAFIANLSENIKEMAEDDDNWNVNDTITLIKESYKGFYSSQVENNRKSLGFNNKE